MIKPILVKLLSEVKLLTYEEKSSFALLSLELIEELLNLLSERPEYNVKLDKSVEEFN